MNLNFRITLFVIVLILIFSFQLCASSILINMDEKFQTNHLKAYGAVYWALKFYKGKWLLNYKGGSFLFPDNLDFRKKLNWMDVSFSIISTSEKLNMFEIIKNSNMEIVELEKQPKVAVYTPPHKEPWDDAVTLALAYAEIPYEKLWDKQILKGDLYKYDWLHLHHEDFSGRYGKFYMSYHNAVWYQKQQQDYEKASLEAGFKKVSEYKCAVSKEIKKYVTNGGFLFAMCYATETLDIGLAAENIDISPFQLDGDGVDKDFSSKLDFSKTMAFENFEVFVDLSYNPASTIDYNRVNSLDRKPVKPFLLFDFSAKHDPVPTMLIQNHTNIIRGFFGLCTSFDKKYLKKSVIILGETSDKLRAKYIHGICGRGTFTFYGGHDPEDEAHSVGEGATDLSLHKNSPGYRLILNNILFPAAKKKKKET